MKKKFLILIAILFLTTNSYAYTDVGNTWSRSYIEWASSRGLFQGYKDGTFKPKNSITNAEFISVISKIVDGEKTEINFKDVPRDAWYRDDLAKIVVGGHIVNSGKFNPNEKTTRIEAFRLIASVYNLISNEKGSIHFNDAEIIDNRAGMIRLVRDKIISGDSDGNLNPLSSITREEICKILKVASDRYGL